MSILMCTLMAYSLVGEFAHEAAGTAMAVLLVAHLWLNRRWFRALPRGRYTPRRAIQTIVVLLVAICVVTTVATGIASSRYVLVGLPIHAESSALELAHMTGAHWGLVFMGLHAGLNASRYVQPLLRRHPSAKWPLRVCALLVSLWGVSALVRRGVWRYLLFLNHFAFMDPSEAALPFVLDYLAVLALFGVVGSLLSHVGRRTPGAGASVGSAA